MYSLSKDKINVFIATSNKEKFFRISSWLKDLNLNIFGAADLDEDERSSFILSDEEEKSVSTQDEKSLLKVIKPGKNFKNNAERIIVLGLDDTAYFPWIDRAIIDLRTPPDIIDSDSKIVVNGSNVRLDGNDLLDYYRGMTRFSYSQEKANKEALENNFVIPEFKFAPLEWRFALALYDNKNDNSSIICHWSIKEYLQDIQIPEEELDSGYILGKITISIPGHKKSLSRDYTVEIEPIKALRDYILR